MAEDQDAPNEIVAVTRDVAAQREAARAIDRAGRNWPLVGIGLGVGIGSAAVAAALLYTNRQRDKR